MSSEALSQVDKKLVAAAAMWGRVAEREGYSELGVSVNNEAYFGTGPDIVEKSALFQRLLSGKEPLLYRPPTSHSYPWYEVIEGLQPEHHVLIGVAISLGSMLSPGAEQGESCISIEGALWRIEETIQPDQEYIVSWGKYPMRWRLQLKRERVGTVQDRLDARESHLLGQSAMYKSQHNLREAIRVELESLEKILRNPKHPNIDVDDNDVCWEKRWILQRIGLSGWPFAGEVLTVTQKEFISLARDGDGDAVLFFADPETESDDPPGEAWIRIEHDAETNTSRYVSMFISALSKLEQKIQDECEDYLESLLDLALSRNGAIFIMDRSESNKEIVRLFRTNANPQALISKKRANLQKTQPVVY